jgi:plastocyanin
VSRRQQLILAVLLPVVVVGALLVGRALRSGDDSTGPRLTAAESGAVFEHDYTIPLGTADRIAAGETVEIVPRELTVKVGESIRIVNDDDEGHVVGVFYVGAGETLTQRFTAPGELSGACTVHSGGEFTLRVVA